MNRANIRAVLPVLLNVLAERACDGKGRQNPPPSASVTSVADDTTMTLTATIATDTSMLVDPPPSLIAAAQSAESQTAQTPASTPTSTAAETASATSVATAPPAAHPGAVNDVTVTLTDYRIALPTTIPAGKTKFKIINHGKTSHSLKLEGNGIEKKLWITLKPGQNATLDADLTPGSYNVYCPVDHHDRKGMRVTLKVAK